MEVQLCSSYDEILQIKSLQNLNLKCNIDLEEANKEGFVTAVYSVDYLKVMNDSTAAVIATFDSKVVGYLLAVDCATALKHELLSKIIDVADSVLLKFPGLANVKYIIVGQLCIAKEFRGQGLVQKMYQLFYDTYHTNYDACVTDIAESNPRSLRAHAKCGFQVMERLDHGGALFDLVVWDWNKLLG